MTVVTVFVGSVQVERGHAAGKAVTAHARLLVRSLLAVQLRHDVVAEIDNVLPLHRRQDRLAHSIEMDAGIVLGL